MPRSPRRWPPRLPSWSTLRLVAESLAALCAVRLALTLVGLAQLRALWLPSGLSPAGEGATVEAARVARAVRVAAHLVPFASCLTQAQAAQILLARHGVASTVCLGVRQSSAGTMAAHAWLIANGRLVLGGAPGEVARFRQLATLAPVR
jgi:hypothetical protein